MGLLALGGELLSLARSGLEAFGGGASVEEAGEDGCKDGAENDLGASAIVVSGLELIV